MVPGAIVDSIITSVSSFKFSPTELSAWPKNVRSGIELSERGVGTQITIIFEKDIFE